uniref:Uncharacterized protein n=1 Tax=Mesoaciditoga lauensis TaxID=1495039 RepID=A0A7V3RFJ9_9BACT
MAVKLILVTFLVFESLNVFGMEIKINDILNLSYGFGSPAVLENLGITEGLSFYQEMNLLIYGEISNGFYLSASVGANNELSLNYVPMRITLGNTISSAYGINNFAIFGISSPYFSFGQLSGSVITTTITVSALNPTVTLGPMLYGSVIIYFNGTPLSSNSYTIDYTTGTIYFSNLSISEFLIVQYQSASQTNGTYLLTANMNSNSQNYNFDGTFCTVVSTPSNQYFALEEIKNQNSSMKVCFNIDESPSFTVGLKDKTQVFNKILEGGLSYTSDGFRYPMGIIQLPGFSGTLSYDNFGMNFDQNDFGLSFDSSEMNANFSVSRENGFNASLSSTQIQLALSACSSNVTTFEEVSNGNLNVIGQQNFSNSKFSSFSSQITVATPLSVQASFTSQGMGVNVSKFIGPFMVSAGFGRWSFIPNIETNFNLFGTFFYQLPVSCNFQISTGATAIVSGALNLTLPSGILSLSVNNTTGVGISFSSYCFTVGGQLFGDGFNLSTALQTNVWGFNINGSLCIEKLGNDFGGSIGLKVWGSN